MSLLLSTRGGSIDLGLLNENHPKKMTFLWVRIFFWMKVLSPFCVSHHLIDRTDPQLTIVIGQSCCSYKRSCIIHTLLLWMAKVVLIYTINTTSCSSKFMEEMHFPCQWGLLILPRTMIDPSVGIVLLGGGDRCTHLLMALGGQNKCRQRKVLL
jgi:hypothetical protein